MVIPVDSENAKATQVDSENAKVIPVDLENAKVIPADLENAKVIPVDSKNAKVIPFQREVVVETGNSAENPLLIQKIKRNIKVNPILPQA